MTPEEWVKLREDTIVEILNAHSAVTTREIEARAANQEWPGYGGVHIGSRPPRCEKLFDEAANQPTPPQLVALSKPARQQ